MSIVDLIRDISLLEFYERKTKNVYLMDYNEITKLEPKLKSNKDQFRFIGSKLFNKAEYIKHGIEDTFDLILDILPIATGKMSLVGLSISQLMSFQQPYEFDLYFHSCSITEANILLQRCLQIIEGNVEYLVADACVIITLGDFCIRIHLELYKDRLEILMNNGPSPERHGYDPEVGYFSTFVATILLIKEVVPVCTDDIDQFLEEDYKLMHMFYDIRKDCDKYNSLHEVLYHYNEEIVYCTKIQKHQMYDCSNIKASNYFGDITVIPYINNISKVDARKYLGKNYYPVTVGISDDKYVALSGIKAMYFVTDDMFKLLCSYWLEAEVGLARERLLK